MLTGCNDLLDKSPLDTFTNTPAYWSNTENLDNQCNTFYNNYSGYGNGSSGGWFYFKTLSDDQVDAENHNWTYTNVVASSTNWSDPFTEIRRASYIIAGVQSSSLDEKTKNHYEGLARMNRAWEYYQLVRMYGDVQWIDKVIDPSESEVLYGPRDDRDNVMDKVLEDINFACRNITANSNRQRFSTDMAYAMKAEIALFEGTYCKYRTQAENGKPADGTRAQKFLQECVSACEYLMGQGYQLSDSYKANYNSISLASNPEMIFYKPYAQASLRHSTIDYTINTSGTHGLSKDAFDSFLFLDGKPLATTAENTDDAAVLDEDGNYSIREILAVRDKRLTDIIDPVLSFRGHTYDRAGVAGFTTSTGYGIAKYDNPEELTVSERNNIGYQYTDCPLYWLSVIYLNFAEAKAELGTLTQSDLDNSINKLQARAGLPDMTINPDADPANNMEVSNLIWEVRRCRRCELIMDNWFRYWDLIRWHQLDKLDSTKYPNIMLGANVSNVPNCEEATKNGYIDASDAQIRTFEAKHYFYPVPTTQLTLNPSMKQNPGWEKE